MTFRKLSLVVLLGLALLAGSFAAPTRSEPEAAQAAGTELSFRAPVTVSANDDQTAAEPSIRAARDGSLYIVAPTGLGNVRTDNESGGGDIVWRSDDNGASWEFLGSLDNQLGGGDADIAPDRDGVLWGSGLTLANTTGAISVDKGENWNTNPINSLATVVDRQWIETYKSEPFAFMATGRIADQSIIVSRLERAPGDLPVTSNTVKVSGTDAYQWPGEIAVDEKNDLVYVTYNTGDDIRDRIVVSRMDLNLGNVSTFDVTTTKGDSFDSFVGLDVDKAGNVYTVWTERRPSGEGGEDGRTNSYVAVSKNQGKDWSRPVAVNRGPKTTAFPWIVAGSRGRVAIAYYGTRNRGPSPEKVTYPDRDIPKWKVWVSYSVNAASADPVYREKVAMSSFLHQGDICTSGTGCASGTRDLADFLQIDLD
ncbi:MAG: hypothetical protein H0U53_05240, partial [Actinobacteria bacterium]|nr:hypothetical protein [Actinomycetota bacterium]